MRNNTIEFSNVLLQRTGKKGVLKELDNGYYEILLGAFGTVGNGGWFYDPEAAMNYIRRDKEFMEMLNCGRLRSEYNHPVRQPGMKDIDWFTRINTIDTSNVSSHIRAIDFSTDLVKDAKGRSVVSIIGQVRPYHDTFRQQFENPYEDVNYSVRSYAERNFHTMTKSISKIITWDSVHNPGIKVASKYHTPSLESSRYDIEDPNQVAIILDSCEFNLHQLRNDAHSLDGSMSFESQSEIISVIDRLIEKTSVSVSVPVRSKFLEI